MKRLCMAVTLVLYLTGCSSDDGGKELGEPCDAHSECVSGLCTIPTPAPDGGAPQKRCTDPNIN